LIAGLCGAAGMCRKAAAKAARDAKKGTKPSSVVAADGGEADDR
jgi:hypothetical protein